MSKSIEYQGHTVMSGSTLYSLLDDTKTHDSAKKAAEHFKQVLVNYDRLTGRRAEMKSSSIPAPVAVSLEGT